MSVAVLLLALRLLLALTLYAFLAAVLLYLRRDLRASALYARQIPRAHLHLDQENVDHRVFPLAEVNLIGRTPDNSIVVADHTVSSHHARLSFLKGQWWLEDLGSRNGTKVNEIPVKVPLVVTHGDRIELGKVVLRFEAGVSSDPQSQETSEG